LSQQQINENFTSARGRFNLWTTKTENTWSLTYRNYQI
jgi:hypothetical protein